jgi:hypothetical protein
LIRLCIFMTTGEPNGYARTLTSLFEMDTRKRGGGSGTVLEPEWV